MLTPPVVPLLPSQCLGSHRENPHELLTALGIWGDPLVPLAPAPTLPPALVHTSSVCVHPLLTSVRSCWAQPWVGSVVLTGAPASLLFSHRVLVPPGKRKQGGKTTDVTGDGVSAVKEGVWSPGLEEGAEVAPQPGGPGRLLGGGRMAPCEEVAVMSAEGIAGGRTAQGTACARSFGDGTVSESPSRSHRWSRDCEHHPHGSKPTASGRTPLPFRHACPQARGHVHGSVCPHPP